MNVCLIYARHFALSWENKGIWELLDKGKQRSSVQKILSSVTRETGVGHRVWGEMTLEVARTRWSEDLEPNSGV